MTETPPATRIGLGVDAAGNPVIDPTANVLQLVAAAMERQDDLRHAEERRQDELRESEAKHLREIAELRSHFGAEIRRAEAARIDAIRSVDVSAVNRAAEVAATQATALAAQVAASAEAMRNQVAAAAQAAAIALEAALKPVQVDIADLRRAQYEAQGKTTAVVDTRARGASVGMWIGVGLAVFGFLVSVIAIIAAVIIAKP